MFLVVLTFYMCKALTLFIIRFTFFRNEYIFLEIRIMNIIFDIIKSLIINLILKQNFEK